MSQRYMLRLITVTGADVTSVRQEDSGRILSDVIRSYMTDLGIDDGLKAVGYSTDDIPALVKATLPQVFCFVTSITVSVISF